MGQADPADDMTVTVYLADDAVPDDVARYAGRCGLAVDLGLAPQAVRLSGPVAAVQRCFGVRLLAVRTADGGSATVADGPARVPRSLARDVIAVLGLDTRTVARRHD